MYLCDVCGLQFVNSRNLHRHIQEQHDNRYYDCPSCDLKFKRTEALKRHLESCQGKTCESSVSAVSSTATTESETHKSTLGRDSIVGGDLPRLQRSEEITATGARSVVPSRTERQDVGNTTSPIPSTSAVQRQTDHANPLKRPTTTHPNNAKRRSVASVRSPSYTCRYSGCGIRFSNRGALIRHQLNMHRVPNLPRHTWDAPEPWIDENNQINQELKDTMLEYKGFIFDRHRHGHIKSIFNFPVRHMNFDTDLLEALTAVREARYESLKLNMAAGMVLRNIETDEYRYFVPGMNSPLLDKPVQLDSITDWDRFLGNLDSIELMDRLSRERPDTKWRLEVVCNVKIDVYYMGVTFGLGDLPDYVKHNPNLRGMTKNNHGVAYRDELCVFRAVVVLRNLSIGVPWCHRLEEQSRDMVRIWCKNEVRMNDIEEFERVFDLRINIYSMDEHAPHSVYPRFLSRRDRGEKMVFNLFANHICPVTNPDAYLKRFVCIGCHRHFQRLNDLKKHRGRCGRVCRIRFTRRHYNSDPTIFERLDTIGVIVPVEIRFFPWHAEMDCESYLEHSDEKTQSTQWLNRHELISLAISSNVPSFRTGKCFVNTNQTVLAKDAVAYLVEISNEAYQCALDRWARYIRLLNADPTQINDRDERVELETLLKGANFREQRSFLGQAFDDYCRQLIVVGFNSSKYDFNVLRSHLFEALNIGGSSEEIADSIDEVRGGIIDDDDGDCANENDTVVDNGSDIDFEQSIDVIRTLCEGGSEHEIVGVRDIATKRRSNGCYVIKKNSAYTVVSVPRLKFLDVSNFIAPGFSYAQFLVAYGVTEPKGFFPYEWFDSTEKLEHREFPPYESFYSSLKAVNVLDNGEDEEAGRERHAQLKADFERNMSTFRDYLVRYNLADVEPFTKAVDNMLSFYFRRGIDLFKVAVSVPGVARRLLYTAARREGVSFSSVRPEDQDMYHLIRKGLVGGPSIIFNRYHRVGETCIRGDLAVVCGNILGYDANALYLWCIDQLMPCGDYIRRFSPDFRPRLPGVWVKMFDWMDYVALTDNIEIRHQRNSGEVKIGPYRVDGFVAESTTVLEFDGCYFHGCETCCKTRSDHQITRAQKTEERKLWLEENGYTVRVMKEHDFDSWKRNDKQLRDFVLSRRPPFYQKHKQGVTEAQIIDAVKNGDFYGFLEVDIRVPAHLFDMFAEMSPIFANVDVSYTDIGETMQKFVQEVGMSTNTRRLLVGGMSAKNILLSSDLLVWYLTHGLVVDCVHQVMEYTPVKCFQNFVTSVTEARRDGDVDPSLKVVADTMKLIGNSAYGSMIMNKEKHRQICYFNDVWKTQLAINDPRFYGMEELGERLFEVSRAKRTITLDLPIQLGFQILQLAKLRILQFYYDCLAKQFDKSRFEMLEGDTDSLYFAVGGPRVRGGVDTRRLCDIALDKHLYDAEILTRCNQLQHLPADGYFFPRECCDHHQKYDSRTPGLFKLEAQGRCMIGLSSKTYCLQRWDAPPKVASKGLSRTAIADPIETFTLVLNTKKPAGGYNVGFRAKGNTIYTYRQKRTSLSWFYCKRVVQADGIHTMPLAVTLQPWPKRSIDIVTDSDHPLWPIRNTRIDFEQGVFGSLVAVCEAAEASSDRDSFIRGALLTFTYKPLGHVVFVDEGIDDKKLALRYTSGCNARSAVLIDFDKYPGTNLLGRLYDEIWGCSM